MSARRARAAAAIAVFLAASSALAQSGTSALEREPNDYPPPLPERRGPAPKLQFAVVGEIALAGPVTATDAWSDGDSVAVPLASGVVRVPPSLGAAPVKSEASTPPEDPHGGWIVSSEGTHRYRTTAEGLVEAEHYSKWRKRWTRSWRIVTPNSTPAAPLLIGPRLCYAGLDDRVTCVRASNGHRLWTADLGDRLSRPLARWPSATPSHVSASRSDRAVEGDSLLVVPDDGESLVALDAYDGRRLATYKAPSFSRIVSGPMVFSEDRIAAVRTGFEESDVAVVLLRLEPVTTSEAPAPIPYNDGSPAKPTPNGR